MASSLHLALPGESLIYLGDTARLPYGDKSPDTVLSFGLENSRFLISHGVKLIIVACNTVSALAVDRLRESFPETPIIGVLEAGVAACLEKKPAKLAVIGTRATVRSDAYRRKIHEQDPSVDVVSIACPLFVPLVEEGLTKHEICRLSIEHYLSGLKKSKPDLLLLACTHYPLLREELDMYFDSGTDIVDSAEACALYAECFLHEKGIPSSSDRGRLRFFATDISASFQEQVARFSGSPDLTPEFARLG